MTSMSHLYSDLSAFKNVGATLTHFLEEDVEDAKLSSFEGGYKAGWDDAAKAQNAEDTQLRADILQQLQDMSFTYHEAYSKLTAGMQPLMLRLIKSVLPVAIQKTLGAHIVNEINMLVENQTDGLLELAVSAEGHATIAALLEDQTEIPFSITSDPTLSDAQVFLRIDNVEREINLDTILAQVTDAVDAFFHAVHQKEQADG
ncbi:MAG: hypothetical protein ABJL67_19065 [Sulfitobacter sp.]